MILYHFPTSPFARRVRIGMNMKGITAELRDARADANHKAELQRLNPMHTTPLLVDGDRVITQSAAIVHYLDEKQPAPPLWPSSASAKTHSAEWISQIDSVISILVDLAVRYANLHGAPEFAGVRKDMCGRAQRTLDALTSITSSKDWFAAEHAVYTFVAWSEGLAARAPTFPTAQRMLDLGIVLPPALTKWADQHRQRPEVLAL